MIHRWRTLGIRWRLTLWYTAILMVAFVLVGCTLYGALKLTLDLRVDQSLRAEIQQIMPGITSTNGQVTVSDSAHALPGLDVPIGSALSPEATIWVQVFDAQRRVIYRSPAMDALKMPERSVDDPLAGQGWDDSIRVDGVSFVRFLSVPVWRDGRVIAVLQVGQSLATTTNVLTVSVLVLCVLAPVLLVLAGVGSYWLSGRAFAPMRSMIATAHDISANDLHRRVPVPSAHDDVRVLAEAFNDLLTRLEAAFVAQRRFIADASHDLRTPVSAILSLAENARDGVEVNTAASFEVIAGQAQHMRGVLANLLQLARADEGRLPLDNELLRFDLITRDCCLSLAPLADTKSIQLQMGRMEPVSVNGDITYLTLVLTNILANAIAYTPSNGSIILEVWGEDEQAICIVRDTGIGISDMDLPHVFDRFYRASSSRQITAEGSGLGLSIVKALIEAHGGSVTIESEIGRGTLVRLSVPRSD